MKVIEAMKIVKYNKEKIEDLHEKISKNCANSSLETPVYGEETGSKIKEWLQSCTDLSQENVRLLCSIQKTNLQTMVTIELGNKNVTKSVSEWVWRRREYAKLDAMSWSKLTDRNLQEVKYKDSLGVDREVKIVRHFNPIERDEKMELYKSEPHKIDSALEISNALTDLVDF